MSASLPRLVIWEVRRLRGEHTSLVLLAVWLALLIIATWQGTATTRARHAEINTARASDVHTWQEKRQRWVEISAGRVNGGAFSDPRSPTHSVLGAAADRPLVQIPPALAPLAVADIEVTPAVRRSGMVTRVYLPPDSLENPANRLAGRLDFAFVVGALLPLFALALCFDVLARDRDLGIWPLMASQPTPVGRVMLARLFLQFLLLWVPLALAASASCLIARPPDGSIFGVLGELSLWLLIAGIYLVFWQSLAAIINRRGRTAAGNALALCGAWLAIAVLIPAGAQFIMRSSVPEPDPLRLILAQRDVDIELHGRIDQLRPEFYARRGYVEPTGPLNEYDAFFVGNIVPRAFMTDELLAPTLDEIHLRREARSRYAAWLSALSPALAFRMATDQLAGVTPAQRGRLIEEARDFQRAWRAHFGAKLASMSPLVLADYDNKPEPPVIALSLSERLQPAVPALAGLLAALALTFLTLVRAHDHH